MTEDEHQVTPSITYRGPVGFVSALARELRDRDVNVDYEPPPEERGVGGDVHEIVLGIVAAGIYDSIKSGVVAFLGRFGPHGAKVDLPDEED